MMNFDGGLRFHRMNSMSANGNPLNRIRHAPPSPTGFSRFCLTGCGIHPPQRAGIQDERFHRMNSMSANGNPLKQIGHVPPSQQASACFAWQAAIHPQHPPGSRRTAMAD
jgi:hypothetical protein